VGGARHVEGVASKPISHEGEAVAAAAVVSADQSVVAALRGAQQGDRISGENIFKKKRPNAVVSTGQMIVAALRFIRDRVHIADEEVGFIIDARSTFGSWRAACQKGFQGWRDRIDRQKSCSWLSPLGLGRVISRIRAITACSG
jgi:hypothetical protein